MCVFVCLWISLDVWKFEDMWLAVFMILGHFNLYINFLYISLNSTFVTGTACCEKFAPLQIWDTERYRSFVYSQMSLRACVVKSPDPLLFVRITDCTSKSPKVIIVIVVGHAVSLSSLSGLF